MDSWGLFLYAHNTPKRYLSYSSPNLPACFRNIDFRVLLMDDTLPKPTIHKVIEYYGEDLPTPSSLDTELHLWQCKWRSSTRALPAHALTFANKTMFPNIHGILRLVCALPVTSCERERSVGILRRLKTYLRSTISQDQDETWYAINTTQ